MLASLSEGTRETWSGRRVGASATRFENDGRRLTMLRTSALGRRTARLLAATLASLLLLGATAGPGAIRADGPCNGSCPTTQSFTIR
jgi:hypothetical protein